MAQVDPCTASGLTPFVDSSSGIVLYCLDANGNAIQLPAVNAGVDAQLSGGVLPTTTPGMPGSSSVLSTISSIENDFLTGWRQITAPGLPPGQVGVTLGYGPAGAQLSGSPILLIALLALAFILVKDA